MGYTDTQFLAKLKPYVLKDMKDSDILASLTAAQAFIESNKGNSGLTVQCNNLFGIKGTYNGQSGKFMTTEYYNGKATKVQADFRKYPSWQESITDHSSLFNRLARYKNLRGLTDYNLACQYVRQDGYATSPTYTQTLLSCINRYKLYEWDREVLGDMELTTGTYTTMVRLNVRVEPCREAAQVPKSALTADAQKKSDDNGVLNSGIRVTVRQVSTDTHGNVWGKIPSGWIALRYNGNTYVCK